MADSDYDEENETYFITQNKTILRTLQSAYGSIDGSDDGELNSEAAGERSLEGPLLSGQMELAENLVFNL